MTFDQVPPKAAGRTLFTVGVRTVEGRTIVVRIGWVVVADPLIETGRAAGLDCLVFFGRELTIDDICLSVSRGGLLRVAGFEAMVSMDAQLSRDLAARMGPPMGVGGDA